MAYLSFVKITMSDRHFAKIILSHFLILTIWSAMISSSPLVLEVSYSKSNVEETRQFRINRLTCSVKSFANKITSRQFIVTGCHHITDVSDFDELKNKEELSVSYKCLNTLLCLEMRLLFKHNARNLPDHQSLITA